MAKTIAIAKGHDTTRCKETHRLGSKAAEAQANTWRTFATVLIRADGSGEVYVKRDDTVLHAFQWGPESED